MHSLVFSNACFRQPGCMSLLQCTVALYYDVIAIDVMKLLACIYQYSCVKVPIQLPTYVVGTERKRRKRMAANEYTRDVGVTAFSGFLCKFLPTLDRVQGSACNRIEYAVILCVRDIYILLTKISDK